jgi:hypothetical protein
MNSKSRVVAVGDKVSEMFGGGYHGIEKGSQKAIDLEVLK